MSSVRRFEGRLQPGCVVHGEGALATLSGELERLGATAPALLTSPALVRERRLLGRVRAAIGMPLALEFDGVAPHVPRPVVAAAARRLSDHRADALVALGGGSAIDTAKAVVHARLAAAGGDDGSAALPIVVLPTTLSGSEYTNLVGVLDPGDREKRIYRDDRLLPAVVLLDPVLASATPARLWATSAIKCLSDATEQLCSPAVHPIVETVATEAVRRLARNLGSADPQARLECYLGAWMALFAFAATQPGLGAGAALRHRAAAVTGAGHADLACALLPQVLVRALPAAPRAAAPLAAALGLDPGAAGGAADQVEAIAAAAAELVRSAGGPRRLAELGVREDQLDEIASAVEDVTASGSPYPLSEEGLRQLLADAW